jgi:integrase/recombinase XerD
VKARRALARGKALATDGSGARSDGELVRLWLLGRPASTLKAYGADLEWWRARGVPARGGWRSLRFRDIERAFRELEASPATRARRVATLRSLLAWGHRIGYLPLNVGAVLRLPPVPDKLAERILDPDEVMRLLVAAGAAPRQGPRDHAFVRLAYVSGARVDELVRLDWEHIHTATAGGASLTLHGKGSKTRHVWITQGTADELAELGRGLQATTGAVFRNRFGKRLAVRDAERLVEAAAARAGLGKVSPHWLRHSHSTHALERGAPIHQVAADLGHSSVATTSRYLHARPGTGSARWLGL